MASSSGAAERVMVSTSEFIEQRLKLRVNRGKSAVPRDETDPPGIRLPQARR
jgi:hypothetical protein